MAEEEPVPDERRCNRTDGRHWRCKRPVKEGKLLCEIHFEQVRLRNGRIKVPDSLKLQRANRTSKKNPRAAHPNPPSAEAEEGGIRANGREHLHRKTKRKRSSAADADDLTEKNAKGKADELLSALAKRKKKTKTKGLEKKKKKNAVAMAGEQCGEEITKELPYGRMAISSLPESGNAPATKPIGNAASPPVKLGSDPPNYRLVNRRFRSKNVEQPPISTFKAVPYAVSRRVKVKTGGGQGGRRKCHWCQRTRNATLNKCLSCKKRFFCSDCIKERSIEEQDVKLRCPVCHGTCECNACLVSHPKDANSEDNLKKQCKISKYLSLHYMISLVLPILEQINEEQRIELEMEAKLKEQSLSEVEIRQAEIGEKKQTCCNKCSSLILDMHRSCSNCSYNLCLSCCQETRVLMLQDTGEKVSKKSMQNDGSLDSDSVACLSSSRVYGGNIFCPSLDLGGCSNSSSVLDLRCVFPLNYTRELEISAKEIILSDESPKILDPSLHCSLCSSMAREGNKKELLEASRRKHPGDNFLYCPSIHDDYDILLVHFQKHWRNCHPVIFRDLLEKASTLTWDPISMFSSYLKMELSSCENNKEENCVPNCKDWYKIEFGNKESFNWLLTKVVHSSYETLKLKAKLSSVMCQRVFSAQYAEILNVLPIQEYINPKSGLLNLAAKLEEDSQLSEFSPHIHITCGNAEEMRKGELANALSYHSHDLVNILVHASDFSSSTDQVNKIKTLVRMKNIKDMGGSNGLDLDNGITEETGIIRNSTAKAQASETESNSSMMCSGTSDNLELSTSERESGEERPCGIQWDVFRRQDTPKLVEYIQKYSDEFYDLHGSSKQAVDSILDGNLFLDSAHKIKLKHEFKIEPWTFNQKIGEAVFIPAGCPYQMTNLKSCVNVVLGFVSPENAGECIKLADKLHDLPTDHNSKASRVEVNSVEKMVINKISKTIEEMRSEAKKTVFLRCSLP